MRRAPTPALLVFAALGLGAGCLREASQRCANGDVCPPGLLCVDTSDTTNDIRICAPGTCGNGRPDREEHCDDGNNRSGDGCPADCAQPCGDGVIDPGELCDDGNTVDGQGTGDGCSADCLARNGELLVSPGRVNFQAAEGGALPATISVDVHLEDRDDTALIGYAPGTSPPTWLSIVGRVSTDRIAQFELRVHDTSVVGSRSSSVRFQISHPSSTKIEVVDLPVTYSVVSSDLAIAATPTALAFVAMADELAVPPQPVELSFNGDPVALVGAPPWVSVSPPVAPATSPAIFEIAASDLSFPAGSELSGQLLFRTRRGPVERTLGIPITYRVVAAPGLSIQAAPSTLIFNAAAGGVLPSPRSVSATFTGTSIEVREAPTWVTVSAPANPAVSPTSLTVTVTTTAFSAGTVRQGSLVLRTWSGLAWRDTTIALEYRLLAIPELEYVAPYVGRAEQAGRLLVRGHRFPTDRAMTLRLGDATLAPAMPESATQLTLEYPPLPPGRYPVTLLDPPGSPHAPELIIVPSTPFPYQVVAVPGERKSLLYDAERQAIYGVNEAGQQIDHFTYVAGAWRAVAPHPIPEIKDLAMAPDGRSLLVVDKVAVSELSLTDGLFAPILRATLSTSDPYYYFTNASAANNGKLLLLGSDWGPLFFYDLRDHSLMPAGYFYYGRGASSADGSRIYIVSSAALPLTSYDALADSLSTSDVNARGYQLSVSADAGRFLVSSSYVYDRMFTLLGWVGGSGQAQMSRDGGRTFVYVEDFSGPRLEIYDLNAPLSWNGYFPLLHSIPLPDAANTGGRSPVAMTSNLEDTVVFISGNGRLLIVPLE
jgi:cysteine-rich repeat protein